MTTTAITPDFDGEGGRTVTEWAGRVGQLAGLRVAINSLAIEFDKQSAMLLHEALAAGVTTAEADLLAALHIDPQDLTAIKRLCSWTLGDQYS
jgi:hypothetical protein